MAKDGRVGLRLWDRLVLLVAWLVTCGLVYLLGFYVGKGTQERRPVIDSRLVRLPVTSTPPPEGQRPKSENELTFYDTLVAPERGERRADATPVAPATPPAHPAEAPSVVTVKPPVADGAKPAPADAAPAKPTAPETRIAANVAVAKPAPDVHPAVATRPADAPAAPKATASTPPPPAAKPAVAPAVVAGKPADARPAAGANPVVADARPVPAAAHPGPVAPVSAPVRATGGEGVAAVPATARPAAQVPTAPPVAVRPAPAVVTAPASGGGWTVLASPTRDRDAAESLLRQLRQRGYDAAVVRVQRDGDAWYRLRVGRYQTAEQAEAVMHRLREHEGVEHAFVANE